MRTKPTPAKTAAKKPTAGKRRTSHRFGPPDPLSRTKKWSVQVTIPVEKKDPIRFTAIVFPEGVDIPAETPSGVLPLRLSAAVNLARKWHEAGRPFMLGTENTDWGDVFSFFAVSTLEKHFGGTDPTGEGGAA